MIYCIELIFLIFKVIEHDKLCERISLFGSLPKQNHFICKLKHDELMKPLRMQNQYHMRIKSEASNLRVYCATYSKCI